MPIQVAEARARVEALRASFGGRASGLWVMDHENRRLRQVVFAPAPDLPAEVASTFANATRSVPLDRLDLGIVRAVADREPAVSVAEHLPADSGSGRWLRAFGAKRSVAVPLIDGEGIVQAVLSVALPEHPAEDSTVAALVRDQGAPFCS
ncbi:hypothetical protein BH23PLA1_BH23PLA1_10840 [soil metagenome]